MLEEVDTRTLTEATDALTGTAGNDTFIAGPGSEGGVHTLGVSDVINGAAGTADRINITMDGNELAPNMSNVEQVFTQALSGTNTINFVNTTGVQQLWNDRSTANLSLTNVQEAATLGLIGRDVADYSVTFSEDAYAATDTTNVALDGAGRASNYAGLTLTNATSILNLAVLNDSFLDYNGNTLLTDLTAAGAGSLELATGANSAFTSVDVSELEGGIILNANTSTANGSTYNVLGSAAADSFFLSSFGRNSVVDGGEGNDALGIAQSDVLALQTAGNLGRLDSNVSNVEALLLTGGTGTAAINTAAFTTNFDIVGTFGNQGTLTLNNLDLGTDLAMVNGATASGLTANYAGSGGTEDAASAFVRGEGTLIVNGVETLDVSAVAPEGYALRDLDASVDINLGASTDSLKVVNYTGLDAINATTNANDVTIVADSSAEEVNFAGGVGVDSLTISNSAQANITGSVGADSYTLATPAGATQTAEEVDTISYSAADQGGDTIINFSSGAAGVANQDVIQFAADLQTGNLELTNSTVAFQESQFGANGRTELLFTTDDSTLYVDFDGDGQLDFEVTLTGVTDFTEENFAFA